MLLIFSVKTHSLYQIWVDKSSDFYNRSMKSSLQNTNVEIYSTHNERKSVVTKRFIRTLKNKIYKYMTSISKNVININILINLMT